MTKEGSKISLDVVIIFRVYVYRFVQHEKYRL